MKTQKITKIIASIIFIFIILTFLWFCISWVTVSIEFFKLSSSIKNDWWTGLISDKDNKFELYLLATNTFIWMPAQILTAIGIIFFAGWNIIVLRTEAKKRDLYELRNNFHTCLSQLGELFHGEDGAIYSQNVAAKLLSCVDIRAQTLVQQFKMFNVEVRHINGEMPSAKVFAENYQYIMSLTLDTEINKRMYKNSLVGVKIVELMKFSSDLNLDYVQSQIYNQITSSCSVGQNDPSFLYLEYFNSYRMFENDDLDKLLDFFIYSCERYHRSHMSTDSGFVIYDLFYILRKDKHLTLKLLAKRFINVRFVSEDKVALYHKDISLDFSICFESEETRLRFDSLDVNRKELEIKNHFFDGYSIGAKIYLSSDYFQTNQ